MKERDLQREIVRRARTLGWRVASFPKIQDVKGVWRTPVAADGRGWPDLLLVRERVVVIEVKTGTTLTGDQTIWLQAFRLAGVEAYVIRPADWNDGLVDGILTRRTRADADAVPA